MPCCLGSPGVPWEALGCPGGALGGPWVGPVVALGNPGWPWGRPWGGAWGCPGGALWGGGPVEIEGAHKAMMSGEKSSRQSSLGSFSLVTEVGFRQAPEHTHLG